MQTTYRLKAQEISMAFLKSLKTMFAGQEVEIIIKSVEPEKEESKKSGHTGIQQMISDNRKNAPIISPNIDIRGLIDGTHDPISI